MIEQADRREHCVRCQSFVALAHYAHRAHRATQTNDAKIAIQSVAHNHLVKEESVKAPIKEAGVRAHRLPPGGARWMF